jgi:hypothetical protein
MQTTDCMQFNVAATAAAAAVGPLLDLLARGLVEVRAKRLVGPALDLDRFLDAMLRR